MQVGREKKLDDLRIVHSYLERLLDTDPDLDGAVGIDRLGYIYPQDRALDKSKPGNVESETDSQRMGHVAFRMTVDVGISHIVKRREVDAAQTGGVIQHIPIEISL